MQNVDRLYHRVTELECVTEPADDKHLPGSMHAVTACDLNPSTASGRMTAGILVSAVPAESERSGERIRRTQQRAAEGRPHGGPRSPGQATSIEVI